MLVEIFVAILLAGTSHAFSANCSNKFSDLAYSINTVVCPAQCWTSNHTLCGNGSYGDGPLCLAAIHAGVASNSGGAFNVYLTEGFHESVGASLNGVKTNSCLPHSIGYSFEMTCGTTGKSEYSVVHIECPPSCESKYFSKSEGYSLNSSVCAAAINASRTGANGGNVTVYHKKAETTTNEKNYDYLYQTYDYAAQVAFTFTDEDDCSVRENICKNNGTCEDGINTFFCHCASGYDGTLCENNVDECLISPCQNNATCKDLVNDYNCTCAFGYSGKNCTEFIGGCFASPCRNGANCSVDYTQTSTTSTQTTTTSTQTSTTSTQTTTTSTQTAINSTQTSATPTPDHRSNYTCQPCVAGYNGTNCENNIDECASGPCLHGGTCTDGVNGYNCTCAPGYNGPDCEKNIDECKLWQPCEHGSCADKVNDYNCTCTIGYDGKNCSNDIDDCPNATCMNRATCVDKVNDYKCKCAPGYEGSLCEVDINECLSMPCKFRAKCTDLVNDYSCECKSGYKKQDCSEIPFVCKGVTCDINGICIEQNNKSKCICHEGFSGNGILCGAFCPEHTVYSAVVERNVTFEFTAAGTSARSKEKCKNGRPLGTAACLHLTATSAISDNARVIKCHRSASDVLDESRFDNISNFNTNSASNALADLQLVTSGITLQSEDIEKASSFLMSLSATDSQKVEVRPQSLYNAISIVDAISFGLPGTPSTSSRVRISANLVNATLTFTDRVQLPPGTNEIQLSTDTSTVQVTEPKREELGKFDDLEFGVSYNTSKPLPVNVTIPGSILDDVGGSLPPKFIPRISFLMYTSSNLFPTENDTSVVLTINIRNASTKPLNNGMKLVFNDIAGKKGKRKLSENPTKSNVTDTLCTRWDEKQARWRPTSCAPVPGSEPPRCNCYKLGSFSMLVSSKILPTTYALGIFTTVGLSISIAGVLITIAVCTYFKELRERFNTGFLINICLCLFIINVIFLTGMSNVENDAMCYLSAVLLHYFLLAVWFWMACYAYTMYQALVKVLAAGSNRTWKTSALISYLGPLVVIGVVTGVTIFLFDEEKRQSGEILFFESSYRARHVCWLHLYSLDYGFILPVGILAAFNIASLISIMVSLTCKRAKIRSTAQRRTYFQDLLVAFTLFVTFGLTWLFGFFMFIAEDVTYLSIMSWLFTIFNSSQGFTLFILNCVKQEKVRKMWFDPIIRAITCGKLMKEAKRLGNQSRSTMKTVSR